MRCLTLADTLKSRGISCRFLCREHEGHMADEIGQRGHAVTLLPTPEAERRDSWLGVDWQFDATQCRHLVQQVMPRWLIVDHYGLDSRWETEFADLGTRIVVLDDLADRPHVAALLLDQTYGRDTADYDGLVPLDCKILCGPHFAILRPEFPRLREKALGRRRSGECNRLLLSMGGYDANNATGRIIDFLIAHPDLPLTHLDVVLGSKAPWLKAVDERLKAVSFATKLHVDTLQMPELIMTADLCVGAAGTSSWERCALGLPTITAILADNQITVAQNLAAAGAITNLGSLDAGFEERLNDIFVKALEPVTLQKMAQAAAVITDGNGTSRMTDAIQAIALNVRPAAMADAADVWQWRFESGAARYYRQSQVPSLQQHLDWFSRALADPCRMMLIIEEEDGPVGHIRFDCTGDNEAEVGICLALRARGRNLSVPALVAAIDTARGHGIKTVLAEVHRDNTASLALFRRAGFTKIGETDAFLQFCFKSSPTEKNDDV